MFPRENVFAVEIPRHAVEKFENLGEVEHLRQRDHFRRLLVVAPDLNQRLLHRVVFFGALAFHNGDGNAVDQENIIRPVGVAAVGVLPFLSDVEIIFGGIREFNELHIALTFLGLDKN